MCSTSFKIFHRLSYGIRGAWIDRCNRSLLVIGHPFPSTDQDTEDSSMQSSRHSIGWADCYSAHHTVAHLFVTDPAPGDMWPASLQVAHFLVSLPQFAAPTAGGLRLLSLLTFPLGCLSSPRAPWRFHFIFLSHLHLFFFNPCGPEIRPFPIQQQELITKCPKE